jgi:hypothetical protein
MTGPQNGRRCSGPSALVLVALLYALSMTVGQAQSSTTAQPHPALSPVQVVRIEIDALGKNDVPHKNAGIEIAYRFASPASRTVNGPLERFIGFINREAYRPMLNHREARYGKTSIDEDSAQVPVLITGATGERVGYVFSLSKQASGRYAACWMIDSVVRFDVGRDTEGWFMM